MGPSEFGFHAVATPVAAWNAAAFLRGAPPMRVNSPPAKTVEPLAPRVVTIWSAPGSHAVTAPLASMAAIRRRALPPMLVNHPPAYTVEPLTARAVTYDPAFGFQL